MPIYVRRGVRTKNRLPWMTVGILAVLGLLYLLAMGALRHSAHEKKGPVAVQLGGREFGQGDLVEVEVYVRGEGRGASGERSMGGVRPTVRVVDEEGREVIGVGGAREIPLAYDDARGCWAGKWAVPWGLEGKYQVVAEVQSPPGGMVEAGEPAGAPPEGTHVLEAREGFLVRKVKVAEVGKGMCIVTLESLRDYRGATLQGPGGKKGDWRVLFDWADWMGANAFWYSGGWTGSWTERLTDEHPWIKSNLEQASMFATEAHRRGMTFGVWIVAYATHGKRELLPKYKYAWDYDAKTGKCRQTNAISLLDEKRVADIAKLVGELGGNPNVDMVGLDYIRTVKGGYEMVDEFVQDMEPAGLPPEWARMDLGRRMAWLGRQVEVLREPGIADAWNWWRARRVRGIVQEIKRRSGLEKPLWVFTLSWQHGMQHGQDPLMMMAAGADLDAVMLYESDRAQYDQLIKEWNAYVAAGEANLVVGDVVDWDLHQRTLAPAGPEEAYLRARTATKYILGDRRQETGDREKATGNGGRERGAEGDSKPETRNSQPGTVVEGVFWHDLERLMTGRLGPYPREEWALAGGRIFSEVKSDSGDSPVAFKAEVPGRVERGKVFVGLAKVRNEGKATLEKVKVEVVKTVGVKVEGASSKELGSLSPGAAAEVQLQLNAGGNLKERGNRVMVGVVCTWEGGKATSFEYVSVG